MRNTVICIGNLLRADDGVGIHVAQRLKEERSNIEVVDLSTGGIEILDYIKDRDKVILIDAIKKGVEPGTIHRITPEELKSSNFTYFHSLDLLGILLLGWQLYRDEMPKKMVILAVEAEDIDFFSDELTTKVRLAIPQLLEIIDEEFKEE